MSEMIIRIKVDVVKMVTIVSIWGMVIIFVMEKVCVGKKGLFLLCMNRIV